MYAYEHTQILFKTNVYKSLLSFYATSYQRKNKLDLMHSYGMIFNT